MKSTSELVKEEIEAPVNGAENGSTPEMEAELPVVSDIDLNDSSLYINRELSTIEFNRRVLHQAYDENYPLLERVKFMAIFSGNMDEFFMVRVSGLKQQVYLGITDRPADGLTPREQLLAIYKTMTRLVKEQTDYWRENMLPALREEGIQLLNHDDLKGRQKRKLRDFFEREIFPVLTPLLFDPGHPFPHISNMSLNLAVVVKDPESGETHFARVKVPDSARSKTQVVESYVRVLNGFLISAVS